MKLEYSKGVIEVEKAEGFLEKARGLRGKSKGSMLFKFQSVSKPVIDMILVPKRLQLIFISEEMEVQEIIHAEPGFNFYTPEKPCKYLLETFSFTSIKKGEKVRVRY